jgi:hypothetical protein
MRAVEGARGKPAPALLDEVLQFLSHLSQALGGRNFQSLPQERMTPVSSEAALRALWRAGYKDLHLKQVAELEEKAILRPAKT